ncbi:MAG: four-carbon acid sugar kinase family protein [Oribacterium sp.]|nr:four-carbon acid sugar kinase family protein [Oribacterium sp.]
MAEIFLGVVADDFTGASDAASMLAEAGVPTVLFNGVPEQMPVLREDIRAIVVAEKSRTIPAAEAVDVMLTAFHWLHEIGARQLYFKYCATFDSTQKGNIGPVADAVLQQYDFPYTLLVPALPVNGRTVKNGMLFVNGVPLAESHMRNHPLTPMTESKVCRLMEMQSKYKAYHISLRELETWNSEPAALAEYQKLHAGKQQTKYYLVPDYFEDAHGDLIADIFGDLPFLTGGSGLLGALGRRFMRMHSELLNTIVDVGVVNDRKQSTVISGVTAEKLNGGIEKGKALLLAGSCSAITLNQISDYAAKGKTTIFLDPVKLVNGRINITTILTEVEAAGDGVLVYSSQNPEELRRTQELGLERVSEKLEMTMGMLARSVVEAGYTRIISAGGETSGAVTKALGYTAFYIGKNVAPGVPIMTPVENDKLRIVLKSGGFGQKDFFERAVEMTKNGGK